MKLYLKYLLLALGITLFIYVLSRIDLHKSINVLLSVNPAFLLLAVILLILVIILKIYKWQLMLKIHGLPYDLKSSAKSWLASFPVESLTPGRVGYLARSYFYEDKKSALSASTIDKLFDLLGLAICTSFGLFLFACWFGKFAAFIPIVLAVIALILIAIVIGQNKQFAKQLFSVIEHSFPRLANNRLIIKLKETYHKLNSAMVRGKKELIFNSLISVTAWVITGFVSLFILWSISARIEFLQVFAVTYFSILFSLLPITIFGIGTREVSLIFLLSLFGVSAEKAVGLSIVLFAMNMITLVIGFVVLVSTSNLRNTNNITH